MPIHNLKDEKDMNENTLSNLCNYNPSSGYIDEQKGELCVERDNLFSSASYYAAIISYLLRHPEANCELDPKCLLPSSQKTELLLQSDRNGASSRETSSLAPLPTYVLSDSSQFHHDHLQAKRARVENIIQGMNIMPNPRGPCTLGKEQCHADEAKKGYRDNKRKQKPLQQPRQTSFGGPGGNSIQSEEYYQLKKQLHVLQHQLKQLQERFFQPCDLHISSLIQENMRRTMDTLKETFGQSLDNSNCAVINDQQRDNFQRNIPVMRGPELSGEMDSHIPTSEERTLSDILKQELLQGVTQAVDSVLKKVLSKSPSLQSQLSTGSPERVSSTGRECIGPRENLSWKWLSNISSNEGSASTIRGKSPVFPTSSMYSKPERKSCQVLHGNYPLTMASSEVQENGFLSQMLVCGSDGHWGSPTPTMASFREPQQPIKLKSSVMRQQQYPTSCKSLEIETLASLSAPKAGLAEMCALMDGVYFPSKHIQEALTPGHLKKAKLMFFFSRYPTSSLLKAYFLDVQMERFARQALLEGVTDPNNLIVTRDSDLFRILNVHYNKGNDFEVPHAFLDVASLTLQEFFNAVREGKDSDPSWKKSIYKIISKLDSEIPNAFKSSSCPKELI
ncbi:prospero homeobox protein 2 isoform X2 [Sceloporus undulatus]|uniref:prospero homeobox protein 2 isoform X2 n=1 Tax=Sceloporus undulatus TaxID=8520 RepID=UPI001C4B6755|nr:prospero homeobox protein 2 isoform X2 [Sceloporus undulatus]